MATLTIDTTNATPRELKAARAFLNALDDGANTSQVVSATLPIVDAAEDRAPIAGPGAVLDQAPPPPPADDIADEELTALEETAEEFNDTEAAEFTAPTEPAPSSARVDNNGVEFDANFCGEAAVPFYATGKTAGQWKRKRNLSETDYDTWYAGRVAALPVVETAEQPVTTANAFTPAPPPPAEPAQPGALSTAGELMAWVAEMQVAKHLDQGAVDNAYATTGLALPDMFPPNSPELIASNVGQVFAILSAQVPA